MKKLYSCVLAAALSLALLCGCAAGNNTRWEKVDSNTPTVDTQGENSTQNGNVIQSDDTNTVPDGSGEAADDAETPVATLTSEELTEWASYFNTMENNGLLRFPYADLENDPNQLAPYLAWLFYDIGETESSFSEEELALLSDAGLWLELDAFRLSRDFINDYLFEKLNISANKTENLIDAANLGIYLLQYDAWYIAHGDTEFRFYEFDRGEVYEDGTVKLFYFNDFLRVAQDDGEMDYIDAEMVVTLAQREDGTWYVVSHEISSEK